MLELKLWILLQPLRLQYYAIINSENRECKNSRISISTHIHTNRSEKKYRNVFIALSIRIISKTLAPPFRHVRRVWLLCRRVLWVVGLVSITRLVILTLFFTSRTQKRLLKDYRPYAEMVVTHLSCSVKFLKTLMVTLEYIWNSMLQLEGPVLLVKRLQICDSFKLKRFVWKKPPWPAWPRFHVFGHIGVTLTSH